MDRKHTFGHLFIPLAIALMVSFVLGAPLTLILTLLATLTLYFFINLPDQQPKLVPIKVRNRSPREERKTKL